MLRKLLALVLTFAFLAGVPLARATALTPHQPLSLEGDESVATTDDARAMLVNPAGMGLRYPMELFENFDRHDPYREWNNTLLTAGGLGLIAQRQRDTSQTYGAAFAFGGEKLRFGWTLAIIDPTNPQSRALMGNSRGAAPGNFVAIPYSTDPANDYKAALTQLAQKARNGFVTRPVSGNLSLAWRAELACGNPLQHW